MSVFGAMLEDTVVQMLKGNDVRRVTMANYRSLLQQFQKNVTDGLSVRIPKTWKEGYAENQAFFVSWDLEQRTQVGHMVEEIRLDNIPSKHPKEKPPVVISRDLEQRTPVGNTVEEIRQDAVSKKTAFRATMQRKMRLERQKYVEERSACVGDCINMIVDKRISHARGLLEVNL
jgi:hypothetical protein